MTTTTTIDASTADELRAWLDAHEDLRCTDAYERVEKRLATLTAEASRAA